MKKLILTALFFGFPFAGFCLEGTASLLKKFDQIVRLKNALDQKEISLKEASIQVEELAAGNDQDVNYSLALMCRECFLNHTVGEKEAARIFDESYWIFLRSLMRADPENIRGLVSDLRMSSRLDAGSSERFLIILSEFGKDKKWLLQQEQAQRP